MLALLIIVVLLFLPRGLVSLLARRLPAVPRAVLPGVAVALLELADVTVRYGGLTAVAGVSFRVEPGEVRAIIGPNGAGKTTLFNAVTGHAPLSAGAITLPRRPASTAWLRTWCRRRASAGPSRTADSSAS